MTKKLTTTIAALSLIVFLGAGCAKEYKDNKPAEIPPAADENKTAMNIFVHPEYGFSFSYSAELKGAVGTQDDISFTDPQTGTVYATIAIAEGIPGIPLADNLIETVMLDGVTATLYHDTDQETGTKKIDRLRADIPGTNKRLSLEVPVEYQSKFDIKEVAKTWKWQ